MKAARHHFIINKQSCSVLDKHCAKSCAHDITLNVFCLPLVDEHCNATPPMSAHVYIYVYNDKD